MVLGMVASDFEQGAGMWKFRQTHAFGYVYDYHDRIGTNKSFKLFIKTSIIYHLYH